MLIILDSIIDVSQGQDGNEGGTIFESVIHDQVPIQAPIEVREKEFYCDLIYFRL